MRKPLQGRITGHAGEYREFALVQHELSRRAHGELFSFEDSRYIAGTPDMPQSIVDAAGQGVDKLHITADWERMLMIACWTHGRPALFEVLNLLRRTGISGEELAPFQNADINDLFPFLYYGSRFDSLRKVCNEAKSRAESRLGGNQPQIVCHLVAEETGRIVASSL